MTDNSLIQITKEQATSAHVDDMLKRQMSLRGEPGVTRDHKRAWYYQNWFIFGLVGLIAAVIAWAIISSFYDDREYMQGPITELDLSESSPRQLERGERVVELKQIGHGSLTLKGEKFFILAETREIRPDGKKGRLDPDTLKVGETIGVFSEALQFGGQRLNFAQFIVRSPRPQSSSQAALTMDQLLARHSVGGFVFFSVVAGLVGLFIGAADGVVCRLPRRAVLCGIVGLLVGLVGGFVSSMIANMVYAPLTHLAMKSSGDTVSGLTTFGFVIQVLGRSLAWCLAGTTMGLAQGIALRSKRLLLYGLLGGVVGGLAGGLLFDPIDMVLLGPDKPSAHWSRLIGLATIGLSVGAMIGIVELLARDAWLRMTQGPLTGKEFLLFKDVMNVGRSPRSDIYLFNDDGVADNHGLIRAVGDECEIEARDTNYPILLNNRAVQKARLRHGDNVTIGRTVFVFQRRKG